ncbi:prepilin-type N-terminal cleavage/methylation domain-containing protein [Mangrovimicrobium sediminis]|uniref:Prepilin-type N-terminal cleavage/methylation domain-containing protein n=1 Tax=Mangrovimicrobium sediminis TaxID=2562682 RepID=A0A4Z0M476_9GAMM|nr:prepilin-type N-terminal cleavage/methylation domain-containing protein [Haliea sp. SAOS-164]TGD74105.1 prepilin-type N-terminal cleavage/methylation domain-containing protein [Haliea sp. SAOS-164]
MRSASSSSGFTLIEVVVSLAVLSLVMVAVVAGMRTLGNTQVALERVTGRVDEVRTVSSFLRDLMESAVIGSDTGGLSLGGASSETTFFNLDDGALEWKTHLLFGESYGGSYVVRVGREGDELMLRWLPPDRVEENPDKWKDAPSRPLVDNLEEFAVALRPDYREDWTDKWPDSSIAPALVMVRLKADGRYWPDLVMQVQR